MSKLDDFDLDVKINKGKGQVKPNITSVALCTPGSCWGCPETSTFASACCNISDNCGD
ncbi:gallidermin/nisin family lantibiotic [Clostridium felsineum]|uniref:gallidermin/nisin family lantibiotic n=1 Tax=Clostridium felsineum TaxID=36839 RepID=UPI00214DBBAE|nr:gallidermin/nisin family lantibiotic [Clostridium felsineum]MCR3761349.1 gallidermin/nisin family lantibiotic [Clostridium felsineum]